VQLRFVVDGQTYATIDTAGNEMIALPRDPVKNGYTFDGWYWDEGTWQRPFTANSLLSEPLTADMSVYAKFTIIHTHSLTLHPAQMPTCTELGNDAYYTCECGKTFADSQGNTELAAIPTIAKTDHTPSSWIIDRNATCLENGSKHTECTACHATMQTESIPATGHAYSDDWQSDATGHWHVATCEHATEQTTTEQHTYNSNYVCKVCGYTDTSLHGTEISTDVFEVDGETLFVSVPNSQKTFSFINAIQVADGATFVVATDLAASDVIRTKTVSLYVGNNVYFVLVENGNDIQLYTVTIRRRPVFGVYFQTNGGTPCQTQLVEEGSLASQPTTSKTGYTFVEWDYNFATPITDETTISAAWTPNKYSLTYDANGGVLDETEYTATFDSAYTLAVPTKEGHTFLGWYIDETKIADENGQSLENWTILEDKTATAKWSINSYTVTISLPNSGAGTVTGSGTYQYGSSVTVTASEPNLGYQYIGWHNEEELVSESKTYTFTMPATNVTVVAKYIVRDEISNFNFTSTLTTCNITGVKDKTVSEIVVPDYVTNIGQYAFSASNSLESVTIGNGVTSIGDNAFSSCNNLETVYWNATDCTSAGSYDYPIFKNCSKLTTVVIGNNVTTLPSYAFSNCNSLTSITIPDSVKSIGGNAFSYCNNLETVYWNATDCTSAGSYNSPIFGNRSKLTTVVIGNNVTTIPHYAFYNCSSLTSVTIGNSVTSIGGYAFYYCSSLISITIPNSVTSIGYEAFSGCSSLTNITISDSVTSIGSYAFGGCIGLKEVHISNIASWCGISFGSYDANPLYYAHNLYLNDTLITDLEIPNGVTSVGSNSFYGCSSLTSITIGDGVKSIGSFAFNSCSSLTSIIIPDSVTRIGNGAFRDCNGLERITLPFVGGLANATSLDYNTVFGYIFGYKTTSNSSAVSGATCQYSKTDYYNNKTYYHYYIPTSLKSVKLTGENILNNAFYNCSSLTSVTIDNSITSIGYMAFYGCSSLTGVTIGNGVTSISAQAFEYCSSLTSITIPNSVTSIGEYAFTGCYRLVEVYNKSNLQITTGSYDNGYVGYYAKNIYTEEGGSKLTTDDKGFVIYNGNTLVNYVGTATDVEIPDTITVINEYAFYDRSLISVTISDSVRSIGSSAFYYCSSLTNVTIGNSVTSIGNSAFAGCSSLKNIAIPDSVKSIGSFAFNSCSSLTSITIPNSVTSIGQAAFYGSNNLKTVYYKGTANEWTKIKIDISNSALTSATRYYYSETAPSLNAAGTAYDGNYWHYNANGDIVIWKKENM